MSKAVLVSAVQQCEPAAHVCVTPPSWSSLPPPQPTPSLSSSQSTEQGPVFCSRSPLASYFACEIVYVCILTNFWLSSCPRSAPSTLPGVSAQQALSCLPISVCQPRTPLRCLQTFPPDTSMPWKSASATTCEPAISLRECSFKGMILLRE